MPSHNTIQSLQTPPPNREEAEMRRVAFYAVIGLCTFAEVASVVAFFATGNVAAATLFQAPAAIWFYRILCYLYPGDDGGNSPIVIILRTLLGSLRHKP